MRRFELYYDDLHAYAQHRLCADLHTSPEEENWEVFPLAIIEREDEEEEKPKNLAESNNSEKGR